MYITMKQTRLLEVKWVVEGYIARKQKSRDLNAGLVGSKAAILFMVSSNPISFVKIWTFIFSVILVMLLNIFLILHLHFKVEKNILNKKKRLTESLIFMT